MSESTADLLLRHDSPITDQTGLPLLDELLASSNVTELPAEQVAQLRLAHIRTAVQWHMAHNPHYRSFCDRRGFSVEQLRGPQDLHNVPLLPASLFKRGADGVSTTADRDREGSAGDGVLHTTSSGTQGALSVVPRDDLTLQRFFATVGIGTYELLGQHSADPKVFNLGPLDAQHLWIAYVMAGVTLFTDGQFYVEGDQVRIDQLISDLAAVADRPVTIVGPPPLIQQAAQAAAIQGVRLHPQSTLLTIGGWKRASGAMVPRPEFARQVLAGFGLTDPAAVRDSFNMVELNTVLFECAEHRLHVPPWLFVDAKDPRTLSPLSSGETGVLGFVDATATSYPGFVLADDFGTVWRNVACACGRVSDVIALDRRINRIEGRGCALKIDQRTQP